MMIKYYRLLFICIVLFGLTSSCEDKDRQSFGKVSLSIDYQETVETTDNSTDNSNEYRTSEHNSSQDELNREKNLLKDSELSDLSLELDVILDENEDLNERSAELLQDYRFARIVINNGTPVTLDLTSLTNYSKTIAIGQAQVAVDLLNLDNLVVYNSVKNVQVIEDVTTSVTFLANDWAVQNQEIEITSEFNSSYTVGDNIPIQWTNSHAARGVKIQMIQNTTSNVVKVLENNYVGNTYNFDTSNESPRNNVGIMITSMLNETMFSRCCFDIEAANEAPTVENVNETTDEDQSVEIQFDGDDSDGDSIAYSIATNPANGSLGSISGDKITYTPNQDFNGTDTFTYKANDGTADSNTATITITVNAINDPPIANSFEVNTDFETSTQFDLQVSDIDEDNLSSSITSTVSNGSIAFTGANSIAYNPNTNFSGTDSFNYVVNDGTVDSAVATVTINVGNPPVLLTYPNGGEDFSADETITITWDFGFNNTGIELLQNDSKVLDINGDVGSVNQYDWTIPSSLSNGDNYKIRIYDAGPGTDFDDSDNTFSITTNNAPVTTDYSINDIVEDVQYVINLLDTDNSSTGTKVVYDDDNDDLTIKLTTDPNANGKVNVAISGTTLTITPSENFYGNESFSYVVNDGIEDSNQSNIELLVNPVNDPPVAQNQDVSTPAGTGLQIVLNTSVQNGGWEDDIDNPSAWDFESNSVEYTIVSNPSNGSIDAISVSPPTTSTVWLNYSPNFGFVGTDTFTYRVSDGEFFADGTIQIDVQNLDETVKTIVNDSVDSTNHELERNTLIPIRFDYDESNKPWTGILYGIFDMNQNFIFGNFNYTLTLGSNNNSVSPGDQIDKNDTIKIPMGGSLIDADTSYILRTYITQNASSNNYVAFLADIDTLYMGGQQDNYTIQRTSEFDNREFANYDRIPITFNSGNKSSSQIELMYDDFNNTLDSGLMGGDFSVITSSSSSDKTVNFDLNNQINDIVSTGNKNINNFRIIVHDYELYEEYASLDQLSLQYKEVINNSQQYAFNEKIRYMLFDSDTLNVEIYIPFQHFNLNETSSIIKAGDEVTITWEDKGLRNSTIDYLNVYRSGGNQTNWATDIPNDYSYTFTPYLVDVEGLDIGDSAQYFLYASIKNSHNNPNYSNPVTFTSDQISFIFDATEVSEPELIYPNGGERLVIGQEYTVLWDFDNISENVNIELRRYQSCKSSEVVLSVGVPNTGSYTIEIPEVDLDCGTNFQFKVINGNYWDWSDAPFEIVEDQPTTSNIEKTIDEDNSIQITLEGFDPLDRTLTYSIVTDPTNGVISSDGSNVVTYTPNANFNGTDSFTYKVNNGIEDSNTSTVTITINAINDAPIPSQSTIQTEIDEDLYLEIELSDYVNDVDGDALSYTITTNPLNGTLHFRSTSKVRYYPNTDFNGTDSFIWNVSDGIESSTNVQVNITVNAMDEFEFIYPLENDIIEFGDNPIIDWNVHPFNEYEVDIYYYFTNGSTSHYVDIGDISSENDSNITWNYDTEISTSLMGYFKFRIKDKASESEFFSEKFKLLPFTNTKINGSTNNTHSIQTNSTIETSVDWNDNIQHLRMGYGIYTIDNELIYYMGSNNLPEEGVGTGNSSTIPSPCWTVEQCTTKKNESFTIPISDKLFNTGTQYLLKTLLMKDGDNYPIFIAEIDTLNISSSKTEQVSILPFENNNFTYYDRIPVTFTASGVDNVQLGLSSYKSGPSWNDYDLTVSTNLTEKTVNFDLDSNNLDDYFNSQSEASTVAISAIDYEFYNSVISSNTDYFGQSNLSVNNNLLSDDIPGSGYLLYRSDTLSVEIQRPHIEILSPDKNSVNTVGQPLEITWQTTGMRNAVVDMCLEKGGENCIIDDTVNDGSLTFTPYLEDLYSLTSPQGSLAGSSDSFEIRLYGINSHENPNEATPVTHQNINYDSGEWWITLDASDINPHEIISPNGGENLVIGDTYNFEWNFEAVAESLVVKLVKQGTGTVVYTEKVLNDGNHPLTIPDVDNGEYKFRLEQTENRSYFSDTSDNSFNIVDSSSSTTYGGDVNISSSGELYVHTIDVQESGSIKDVSLAVSLTGGSSSFLRRLELYLVSPQGTRVLLAGGDQLPEVSSGGYFSVNSNTLSSTNFTDSATKVIYDGTPPYISDHRPEESMSSFYGEDKEGAWQLIVVSSNDTNFDISHASLKIDSEDYPGYIYEEDNGWIYSSDETTGGGQLEIAGNSTNQFLINAGYTTNSNNIIDDLDVQVDLSAIDSNALRRISISLVDAGFNPPRKSVVLFSGDQLSNPGFQYNYNRMKKVRFDDQADKDYNGAKFTPVYTRVKPKESLSTFNDTAYTSFYLSVTNTNSSSVYLNYSYSNKENSSAVFIDTRPNDSSNPSANDMSVSTIEDTALEITLDANDDNDGGSIDAYEVLSQPSNGTLSAISSAGVLTYMPTYNYSGSDSFTYRVKDNDGNYSNTGTVSVTITAVDEQPDANDVTATTNEDTPVDITLTASEYDGDSYSFTVESNPSNGSVTINGSVATYTPNTDFYGEDTFTFKAVDDESRMNIATATITVTAVNDPPVSSNISASTNEDTEVDITLSSTDIEGDSVTYSIVSDVSNGTTSLTDSVVTYSPDANWNGTDTFTYKANDGTEDSNISTVTITVTSIADTEIYIHSDTNSNGDGSSSNPFNNFIDALNILEEDTSTGYGKIILKSGTYDSLLMTNGYHADGSRETDLHIISETGDYTDVIIEDWFFESVDKDLKIEGISLKDKTFTGTTIPIQIKASGHSANGADLILTNVLIQNNTGTISTGYSFIENSMGDITIENSIIRNNQFRGFNKNAINSSGTTYLVDSRFGDNSSSNLLVNNGSIINNSIFANNGKIAHDNTVVNNSVFYGNNEFIELDCFNCVIVGASWGTTFNDGGEIKNSIIFNSTFKSLNSGNSKWTNNYNVIYNSTGLSNSNGSTEISGTEVEALEKILFVDDGIGMHDPLNNWHLQLNSVAIDAGDPSDDFSNEPEPNGNRINAGIYGNTSEAQITNNKPIATEFTVTDAIEDISYILDLINTDNPETGTKIAYDADGDNLSVTVIEENWGTTSINGTDLTFTSNQNYNGQAYIHYKVNDGTIDSEQGTIYYEIAAVNDPPVTTNISLNVDEDSNLTIDFDDFTTNIEENAITYSIVSHPDEINSSLSQINGGTLTYTPSLNFSGNDVANHSAEVDDTLVGTFTYKANNGDDSNISLVNITVNNTENDYSLTYPAEDPSGGTFDGQRLIFLPQGSEIYNEGLGNPGESLTISMWIKPSEDPKRSVLIANEQINDSGWFGRIGFAGTETGSNDGFWEFYHKPNDGIQYDHNQVISNVLPAINTWSHVAMVIDSITGTVKLFVNGAEIISSNYDTTLDFSNNNNRWVIGSLTENSYNNFPGKIDEVAIWKDALTLDQISSLVSGISSSDISNSNLLLYYTFDTRTNRDDSGNNYNFRYNNVGNIEHFTDDTPYN